MVLTDDNFASTVSVVKEGRAIYANIQKFVHHLLAGNANKLLVMFAAWVLGWPEPLPAIQILWLKLITDGLPALALDMEGLERGLMRSKPRSPGEPLIAIRNAMVIVGHGLLLEVAALTAFHLVYQGVPRTSITPALSPFAWWVWLNSSTPSQQVAGRRLPSNWGCSPTPTSSPPSLPRHFFSFG